MKNVHEEIIILEKILNNISIESTYTEDLKEITIILITYLSKNFEFHVKNNYPYDTPIIYVDKIENIILNKYAELCKGNYMIYTLMQFFFVSNDLKKNILNQNIQYGDDIPISKNEFLEWLSSRKIEPKECVGITGKMFFTIEKSDLK